MRQEGSKRVDEGSRIRYRLVPMHWLWSFGLGIALVSCAPKPPAEVPQTFAVAEPNRATASYERAYVGEVQALQRAEVVARIRGRLEAVAVDEGQAVDAGQLLFSIDDRELQQELRRARAAVASAAAELKA